MSDPEKPSTPGLVPESPVVEVLLDSVNTPLTWQNTLVRCFGVGDGEYDHVVYWFADDHTALFYATKGFRDLLIELKFPYKFDPVLDESATECIATMQMADLEKEWRSQE